MKRRPQVKKRIGWTCRQVLEFKEVAMMGTLSLSPMQQTMLVAHVRTCKSCHDKIAQWGEAGNLPDWLSREL